MLTSALFYFVSACAPQASPSQGGLAAVRAVFLRTEGATRAPDDVLVRRLVAVGPSATPVLFDLASALGLEAFLGAAADEAWLCPPERMSQLAFAALAELPQVPVRAYLRERCTLHPERETRVPALRILGDQGATEGLELLLALCLESGLELAHPSVRRAAADSLGRLIRSDDAALRRLEDHLLEATPELQLMACEALAGCARADSVRLLTRLFGRSDALDLAALEALAMLGSNHPWLVGEPVSARLRASLERGRSDLQAAAAQALGRTRDAQAVPSLVASLGAPEIARAAEWALREITGEQRVRGESAWRAWLARERVWWEEEGEAYLTALDAREEGAFVTALRALEFHPLGRDRIAHALEPVLGDLSPELAVLACRVLTRLGARRAVPSVAELLFSSEANVRAAALESLQQLTGAILPGEPRLWEDYVAGP
jgi:HEAT repeat protein